ncbi:fluoride efflux transporter CrcB [Leptolyngbya sp. FACHB-261]|uniref:fluoride efflux transporter CrcB n=1 Tax=Leptolyngbya sp. FACHB-261 TaxID=2692806 RepID=UPI0016876D2C|nr:fluoride efflux transporter CrcB [Leptolyngbya sp. FACHB-261]MBD2101512.1 fluoride efflux transporter CrcB [Leptolyngbya sp. FACHB-261]
MGFSRWIQLLTVVPSLVPAVLIQPPIRNLLAVSLGAIGGALSRYYLGLWFTKHFGLAFPYGTFVINLSGCLLMGFFSTLSVERAALVSPEVRLLIAVGFLGSYTTFSTYGLDTANLIRSSSWSVTLFYWAGSAILGVLSLELGRLLAGKLL